MVEMKVYHLVVMMVVKIIVTMVGLMFDHLVYLLCVSMVVKMV